MRLSDEAPGTRIAFLRFAGPYYHVTTAARWSRIAPEGLRPDAWNRERYELVEGNKTPFVCLASKWNREAYVHMVRNDRDGERLVLLEVSADVVAQLRVELDHTTSERSFYEARTESTEFEILVWAGVPLVCFDVIPPSALTVVGRY